jgi:hypothetical protein
MISEESQLTELEKTELTPMMTSQEARECIKAIQSNFIDIRILILDLYERKGWEALGYESWRKCVLAEFQGSQSYLYRQLEAAQTQRVISPIGEKEIPESQLRPLTQLEPEQQIEAWKRVVENASEAEEEITARLVKKVVDEMIEPEVEEPEERVEVPIKKRLGPPSLGMQFARMAILDLEKIAKNDLQRDEALASVKQWIEKHERRKN